ncbi:hypothetical protein QH494_23205 [Sphingomonas sp. AR_OL41]|uniref:hypothetical protein n=1 Tax=Sphingomonas sp. AR_OL41 TaxID=3042729 RepID=UPI0024800C55|nr:hypothetical protein [Sphingomonas sp. AR_OL41]MDH7975103.1 hypothetical protein [Sphingomonas sp. AR_OL41]
MPEPTPKQRVDFAEGIDPLPSADDWCALARRVRDTVVTLRGEKWWILGNALGVVLFLWFASQTWIEPELRNEVVARSGDALVFMGTALPILVLFSLADLYWLSCRLIARRWYSAMLVGVVAAFWMAALRMHWLYA